MDLKIVDFIMGWSSKFLDVFFNTLTFFGSEYFFIILFFLLYWTKDKSSAFRFAGVYYLSVFVNFGLKNIVRRPRPYPKQYDSFSMPSGHAQSYSVVAMQCFLEDKHSKKNYRKIGKIFVIGFSVLLGLGVCLSRIYLGRHYLSDVIVGVVIGIGCAILFDYLITFLISKSKISLKKFLTYLLPLIIALYFITTFSRLFSTETVIKIYTSVGLYVGVYIGYLIEIKYLKYDTIGDDKKQIKKILLGFLIMFTVYFILISVFKNIYLLPLVFAVIGFMGAYVVPLVLDKVFMPQIKIEE